MNNVSLVGRLTRDIDVRTTRTGKTVGNFRLAVPRQFNKDQVDFIDVTLWNCDKIAAYLTRGKGIGVEGSIYTDKYQDKDGNNRTKVYINANGVYFLPESKGDFKKLVSEEMIEVPLDEIDLPF